MYQKLTNREKSANPDWLVEQAGALLSGQSDPVANAANLSSLLFHSLDDVNWVGFYFIKSGRLLVGPFQGKPACMEIPLGKGVCGTAAETGETQVVDAVDDFEGHITCDVDSRSEIVVPLIRGGEVIGVLDVDSPVPGRFGSEERVLLERIAGVYLRSIGD